MVSTLLGYRLYASNISKTLERLEATSAVKRDADYYAAHIGDVSSVDELLNDYRLYTYAMKAYGLEDQVNSRGLIRKVLESDLSDAASFANKLADNRYRTFAAAFNFKALAGADTEVVQSTGQTDAMVEAYTERHVRQGAIAAARTGAYLDRIGTVGSVDDLLADASLTAVVLGSIGVDPALASRDFLRQALTGTLPETVSTTNPGWLKLAAAFEFNEDGSLDAGVAAQDPASANELVHRYNVSTGNAASAQAAAFETNHFQAKIGTLAAPGDLFADGRLTAYVLTAFGLDPSIERASFVEDVVTGGTASDAPINALPTDTSANVARKERFVALQTFVRGAFGEDAAVASAATKQATDGYFSNYRTLVAADDTAETSSFRFLLGNINSVTDLLARDPVFGRTALNYALEAFDIEPGEASLVKLRRVLLSDASDPQSYVNRLGDERFEKLAAAFNFGADGKAGPQRLVQSVANQTATGTKYAASFGTMTEAQKALRRDETKAYLSAIGSLRTLDDLLADERTLAYALKAYGLDEAQLSPADVRKILTSDLGDAESFANAAADKRILAFARAFEFTPAGTVSAAAPSAQSGANRLSTQNLFLLQTLESQAGAQNEGVRLGLYFLRKAPELTSATGILADKALLEVVRTAFGLPVQFSQLDIDRQVAILDSKLKVVDFGDPKKLDRFISRFATLYDVANPQANAASSPVSLLLGGGASTVSAGVLSLL